ncbi:MAG TPA: hypothetical protein VK213_02325 [Bacteroidales bacterium]|nr:hypothetical protein [Bacteroidales bacterium]
MAENSNEPKKRGRKKGSTSKVKTVGKRIPRNLESLSFEQLQALSVTVTNLMKTKKDEQIRLLRSKLEELEKM